MAVVAPRWPYCPPGKLPQYVDTRVLGQILSDTDADVNVGDLNNAGSAAYGLALENLKVAASLIDAAVTEAGKYDVADLVWLASDPPDQGAGEMPVVDHGALLRRLNAALWVGVMQDRRVRPDPEASSVRKLAVWGQEFLELVRQGRGLVPARGSLGLLPADLAAARQAALGNVALNVTLGGQPQSDSSTVGVTTSPNPPRMFGRTEYPATGDRFNQGFTDGGLGGG